jgi:hypothetical protein
MKYIGFKRGLFFIISGEHLTVGWYPVRAYSVSWKRAEDGRTWQWPSIARITYGRTFR